jgi:hypothetical protein
LFALAAQACTPPRAAQRAPDAKWKGNQMSNMIEQAKSAVEDFEKTKAIERLEEAIRSLESLDLHAPEGAAQKLAERRKAVAAWLSALSVIDRSLDPGFDPQDVPESNLTPPPTSSGVRYPSGVDPKAIPDPAARAQYQEALARNREKADRYRFQDKLRRLESRASSDIDEFVRRFYTTAPADQNELKEIVEAAPVSPERKKKLMAPFAKRESPQ